uniref:EGF-like domain-containing protein n=1 Tax=Strongyloides stercoralis TaxID=6248 RepID=A0A0K0E8L7_STRER
MYHLLYTEFLLLLYITSFNIHNVCCSSPLISTESSDQSIFDPNHPFSPKNIIQDISNKDSEVTFTKVFQKDQQPLVSHHTAKNTKVIKSNNEGLHNTITSLFTIKCCGGSYPIPTNASVQLNFTYTEADYEIGELNPQSLINKQDNNEAYCKLFNGNFTILEKYVLQNHLLDLFNATCKCINQNNNSDIVLDSSCRQLPKCLNNGYRSFHSNNKCRCPQPYFGYICEKKCEQGILYKDHFGSDICSCHPYYQGSECKDIICLNGYHCEIDTNNTIINPRITRYGESSSDIFSRDVSGTVFSLVMIIVLVISMYLLMKHRMQSQNRYIPRRPDLLGGYILSIGGSSTCSAATGIHSNSQRRDMYQIDGRRGYQFRNMIPIEGPPAYYSYDQRRVRRNEVLPPLPSYEDATKLPPLRHGGINVEDMNEVNETPSLINDANQEQEPSSASLLCNNELPISTETDEINESITSKSSSLDNEPSNHQNLSKHKNNYQNTDSGSISNQKKKDSKRVVSDKN